jgi:hypothetical protein
MPKMDSESACCENRTKSTKCGGLETIGTKERIPVADGVRLVRRFSRGRRRYWRFACPEDRAEKFECVRTGGARGTGIQQPPNLHCKKCTCERR